MSETATDPVQTAATGEPAADAAPKITDRAYGVYVEETVAVDNAEAALAAITKHAVEGQNAVTILVKAGQARALAPKKAIEKLAQVRDLDADYEVAADGSFTSFPGVKSKLERTVSFAAE